MTAPTIAKRALHVVSKVSGASASTLTSATFDELGLDSLDRFEILIELEAEFCVELENHLVYEWTCLNEVVKHLESLESLV